MEADSKKPVVIFPGTRFIPDVDENGHIKMDQRTGKWASGTLEVVINEGQGGTSKVVASHSEAMSFTKYLAVREEIDGMNVDELKAYFKLSTEDDKKAEATTKEAAEAVKVGASGSTAADK